MVKAEIPNTHFYVNVFKYRRLSGDQSSFTKAFKKPHPFKNFNTMLDDLGMEEVRI